LDLLVCVCVCDRSAVIGEGQRERKNLFRRVFLNPTKEISNQQILNYYVPRSNATSFYRGHSRWDENDARREMPDKVLKTGWERSGWLTCNPNPTIPSIPHPYSSPIQFCHLLPPYIFQYCIGLHGPGTNASLRTLAATLSHPTKSPSPDSLLCICILALNGPIGLQRLHSGK
jgi:hypothetical protein